MIRPDGTPHHGEMDGWDKHEGAPLNVLFSRRVDSTHWDGQKVRTWEQIMCGHRELDRKEDSVLWTFGIASDLQRRADNVTHATALVYDFDAKQNADYEEIAHVLLLFGFRWWAHSTYSHSDTVSAFRVVLPVEMAIPADVYKTVWKRVGILLGLQNSDPSACSISRMYYCPSCAPNAPRFAEQGLGPCVPWDAIMECWRVEEPKPTTTQIKSRGESRRSADWARSQDLALARLAFDSISPDADMNTWLRITFGICEFLGSEGLQLCEAWSMQSNKYDARQFAHLRRRLGV